MAKQPKHFENWFLIRGLMREAGHWGAFRAMLETLETKDRQVRIHYLEFPGTGKHSRKSSPSTVSAITDFLRKDFLEIINLQKHDSNTLAENYGLALSLGSMVAIDWMNRFPKDFTGVVLVNGSVANLSPFYHRLRLPTLLSFCKIAWETNPEARERKILSLVTNHAASESIIDDWTLIQKERPITRRTALSQLVAAATFRGPRKKPSPKILVLNSLGDRLVDHRCSRAIQKTWKVPLETHASAGHDLPLDDGNWVVEKIRGWKNAF